MARPSIRQAIKTKYMGPTNHRGARMKATAEAGSVIIPYDYALDAVDNHAKAADALQLKWGWTGTLVGGAIDGEYFWVTVSDRYTGESTVAP